LWYFVIYIKIQRW